MGARRQSAGDFDLPLAPRPEDFDELAGAALHVLGIGELHHSRRLGVTLQGRMVSRDLCPSME
ncbi:MAG: hypothetical protein ABWZ58_03175 [Acidimicrobiia bacterium]